MLITNGGGVVWLRRGLVEKQNYAHLPDDRYGQVDVVVQDVKSAPVL